TARPAEERREDQTHALAGPRWREGENVLWAVVTEVVDRAVIRPCAHVDAGITTQEAGGFQLGPYRPPRGAVCVRLAADALGAPDGDDEPDEDGEVTRDRDDPHAGSPDGLGAGDIPEAPPPEEEVDRRIQGPEAQHDQEGRERQEPSSPAATATPRETGCTERRDDNRERSEPHLVRRRDLEERGTEPRMEPEPDRGVLGGGPRGEPPRPHDGPRGPGDDAGGLVSPATGQAIGRCPGTHVRPRCRTRSSSARRQTSWRRVRDSSSTSRAVARTLRPGEIPVRVIGT